MICEELGLIGKDIVAVDGSKFRQATADFGRRVDERVKQHPEFSEKRKKLVEHPFGTVKRTLGFDHFLTRGTENVRTESVMHFLTYNLKRVINIFGTKKLIEQL